jgi:hypothetical protein
MEHHPGQWGALTGGSPPSGPYQAGSLTGAVASQKVTEAFKGPLSLVGNQALRV